MLTGWRYRVVAATGAALLAVGAVLAANDPTAQALFTTHVPVFNRLEPTVLAGEDLDNAILLAAGFVVVALVPLFKPQPRRILDTIMLVEGRVAVAGLGLATLGYFQWSHRLPRATLVMFVGVLAVLLPPWFVWLRHSPAGDPERTIVVGDDRAQIARVLRVLDGPVLGYLAPPAVFGDGPGAEEAVADGGAVTGGAAGGPGVVGTGGPGGSAGDDGPAMAGPIEYLGGLSRLERVLVDHDVERAVLAFRETDRAEFFGALDVCYGHGVAVQVHRNQADAVLVGPGGAGPLVDVELRPWDPQDYLVKRAFDVAFAATGLLLAAPVMLVIAAAIKLEDGGPVLYRQTRTAGLGGTFEVVKFRSMVEGAASPDPVEDDENDRITRVGRVIRATHLDELPQLWPILRGTMSVVGPRAAWTDEERLLEAETDMWRRRWFVKPGLTGLAQVNGAASTDPTAKLRYDLEYIRRQSFWLDAKIVVRQVWQVLVDLAAMVAGRDASEGALHGETGHRDGRDGER